MNIRGNARIRLVHTMLMHNFITYVNYSGESNYLVNYLRYRSRLSIGSKSTSATTAQVDLRKKPNDRRERDIA